MTNINGNVSINSSGSSPTPITMGASIINKNLIITGTANVTGTMTIGNDINVIGTVSGTGTSNTINVSGIQNSIVTSGAVSVGSTLLVSNKITTLSSLNVSGNTNLNTVTINSSLNVSGPTSITNGLITNIITGLSSLMVSGNTVFNSSVALQNLNSSTTNNLIYYNTSTKALSYGDALSATLLSSLNVTGTSTMQSSLNVSGLASMNTLSSNNTTCSSSLNVSGSATLNAVSVNSSLNVSSSSTLGNLVTSGGLTCSSSLNVSGLATIGTLTLQNVNSTTTSNLVYYDTTSKNLSYGNAPSATLLSSLNVTGTSTMQSSLNVSGSATLNTLNVTGNLTSSSSMTLSTTTINSSLNVSSSAILNTLTISGARTISSTLNVSGTASLNTLLVSGARTNLSTLNVSGSATLNAVSVNSSLNVSGTSNLNTVTLSGASTCTSTLNVSGSCIANGVSVNSTLNVSGTTIIKGLSNGTTASILYYNTTDKSVLYGIAPVSAPNLVSSSNSIAVGTSSGTTLQGSNSIAVGTLSGNTSQGTVGFVNQYMQVGSKIVGTGYSGSAPFMGSSVAISGDGTTMAFGGYNDNSGIGATWVYIKINGVWVQQGPKLVGSNYSGANPYQGIYSIALSNDGNTLAVGAPNDSSPYIGATWIFVRSNGTWSQQGPKLVGSGYTYTSSANIYQGQSVALSSDGNTLAIGGYGDNTFVGATWIFTRSGTTWSPQGSKLVGTGYSGTSYQGWSVALSSDGNTLAVGGYWDNSSSGAVWIFTRSGSTWTQQGNKLIASGITGSVFGQSVSLSSDGNTLAIGAHGDNSTIGTVWIFTRSGTSWSPQGSKLIGSGYVGSTPQQGYSVSLSSDGNILAVGANQDNSNIGAAWIFTRSGTTWTQLGSKLVGTGYSGTSIQQGRSVSLSSDGSTLVVGAVTDNSNTGAVWVFNSSKITGSSISIGNQAGQTSQGSASVAIGYNSGQSNQSGTSIAIGYQAGQTSQGGNFYNNGVNTTGYTTVQQKLTLPGGSGSNGTVSAYSKDGNTAIIAGPANSSIYVYTKTSGLWALQTTISLSMTSAYSVSVSGTGTYFAICYYISSLVYFKIYSYSGGSWSNTITTSGITYFNTIPGVATANTYGSFLFNTSISSDGTTCALGVPTGGVGGNGYIYIYVQSSGSWSLQTTIYPAANANGSTIYSFYSGQSVSLSSDGNTLVIGSPYDNSTCGAHIYKRSGTTWSLFNVFYSNPSAFINVGCNVVISDDGSTMVIQSGAYNTSYGNGYAYIVNVNTNSIIQTMLDNTFMGPLSISSNGNMICRSSNTQSGVKYTLYLLVNGKYNIFDYNTSYSNMNSAYIDSTGTTLFICDYSNNQSIYFLNISPQNSSSSIAIGTNAGQVNQGTNAIAIGYQAGQINQGNECVAIGTYAGQSNAPTRSIALGYNAGFSGMNAYGFYTGQYCVRFASNNSVYLNFNTSTGEITNTSAAYTSDIKLKENISDADNNKLIDLLKQIKLKNFNFIDKNMDLNTFGVIANDIQKINGLGEQTISQTEGYIPNIYKKCKMVIESKESNQKTMSSDESSEIKYITNPEEIKNTQEFKETKKILVDNREIIKIYLEHNLVKDEDWIKFNTYKDGIVEEKDHQLPIYDTGSDENGKYIVLLNDDNIDNSLTEVFVYGSYVYDILRIRDPTNFTYLIIASCQTLLNKVETAEKEKNDLVIRLNTLKEKENNTINELKSQISELNNLLTSNNLH